MKQKHLLENKLKEYKVICPLINFQLPAEVFPRPRKMTGKEAQDLVLKRRKLVAEGIDLVDGVKIRYISTEEVEGLKSSLFPLPSDAVLSSTMFVLAKNIVVKDEHDFQLDKTMRNIILALRLLKAGYISGNVIYYILISEKKPFTAVEWSWEEGRMTRALAHLGFKYSLGFEEIPSLKKIIKKIQTIDFDKCKSLRLACKRFQRAYEESDAEDRLIDLMISFEALFLRGEKAVSSAQIVAVACSTLLGKSEEEREEIRSFLTKAYSIRNCIVHGAEYNKPLIKEELNMLSFVFKIEGYLRLAIKKLLY